MFFIINDANVHLSDISKVISLIDKEVASISILSLDDINNFFIIQLLNVR